MSVDQEDVVDAMGMEKGGRDLIMGIFDHFPWDQESEDIHIKMLIEKLNYYIAAIESGQVHQKYDDFDDIKIVVYAKFAISQCAEAFYEYAQEKCAKRNIQLHIYHTE